MLIFWNFCGVPFVYCFSSFYLYFNQNPSNMVVTSSPWSYTLIVVLWFVYYVWDTANSQKNHFRMQRMGQAIHRSVSRNVEGKDEKYLLTCCFGCFDRLGLLSILEELKIRFS